MELITYGAYNIWNSQYMELCIWRFRYMKFIIYGMYEIWTLYDLMIYGRYNVWNFNL